MTELWPWLALVGLGAFHGLNPAMGWLFAVGLGLHRRSRAVVIGALVPIAIGHALSVMVVALLVVAAGVVLDRRPIQALAGAALIGWAIYDTLRRHRVRFGMQVGYLGLAVWSFLMAGTHGAGLMLVPVLVSLGLAADPATAPTIGGSAALALAAVAVHSAAMVAVTGTMAIVVYQWVGVAILRRGWLNLDRIWTAALVATGFLLLLLAGT